MARGGEQPTGHRTARAMNALNSKQVRRGPNTQVAPTRQVIGEQGGHGKSRRATRSDCAEQPRKRALSDQEGTEYPRRRDVRKASIQKCVPINWEEAENRGMRRAAAVATIGQEVAAHHGGGCERQLAGKDSNDQEGIQEVAERP